VNDELLRALDSWRLTDDADPQTQIATLLEQLLAAGLMRASACAVLFGEQYHLGGAEDTRRMAEALGLTGEDRVLDLACYVGGPARQLAREYGCRVVGVDFSEEHGAIADRLTQLCKLADRVRFVCCDAESVPEPDGAFTVAWSQGSFPADLSWLTEIHRLLVPGGRVAFTGLIRRGEPSDSSRYSLDEVRERVTAFGFRVLSAEDVSDTDLEYGWYPAKQKLKGNEEHYYHLMGEAWVRQAYADLDIDIESWRSGREGNGRVVAVKE